jgi:hypothetical protein
MNNKYTKRPNEKNYEFATRIMKGATAKDEHLSARQVHKLVDQRGSRKMELRQVQSSLYYASKKTGKITIHKVKGERKTYTYNHTLGELFGDLESNFNKKNELVEELKESLSHSDQHHALSQDMKFFEENLDDLLYDPKKMQMDKEIGEWKFIKHDKDAVKDYDPEMFVKKMTESRDAIVSTVKHEFTAEQLLDSLENLNQDLHDNVIVAIFAALGKDNYRSQRERKTALMDWHFEHGNMVVIE